MPQDLGDDFTIKNGRYLLIRDSTGAPSRAEGMDKDDKPVRKQAVKIEKLELARQPVPVLVKKAGAGATTGTAADVNLISYPGYTGEYFIIGTQTLMNPTPVAGGLDWGQMDQTNGDGIEWNDGLLGNGDNVWVTGTAPAFVVEYELKFGTAANIGTCMLGLRKVAANAAAYTSYTDYAGFLVSGGTIHIKTRKASGSAVDTDTTQTISDGVAVRLRVLVDVAGNCAYQVNGANPTVVPASVVQWTAGTSVMPFFEFIQGASFTTAIVVSRTCGYQR